MTSEPADDLNALWTPDGKWIIYTSERKGIRSLYRKPADGHGEAEPLLVAYEQMNAEDISRDGRLLIFNVRNKPDDIPGLAILSLVDLKRSSFVPAPARAARFSPNGRWVAYEGDLRGSMAIFVRAVGRNDEPGAQEFLVSTAGKGALTPMWRGDGKELFYLQNHLLMSVEVETDAQKFSSGTPRPLFEVNIEDSERRNRYLVTRDGQRFLVLVKD